MYHGSSYTTLFWLLDFLSNLNEHSNVGYQHLYSGYLSHGLVVAWPGHLTQILNSYTGFHSDCCIFSDSWVELYFQHLKEASENTSGAASEGPGSGTVTPSLSHPVSLHTAAGQMEKLLLEAARESSRSSSSKSSSRNTSTVTSSRAR